MGKIIMNAVLPTKTRMFCSCQVEDENQSCPVCQGLPGAYPVLNKKVVEDSIALVLALNGTINQYTLFDRVNDEEGDYSFLSQYSYPIGRDGFVDLGTEEEEHKISIEYMRMSECEVEKGIPKLEIEAFDVLEEDRDAYVEAVEKIFAALSIESWDIVELIEGEDEEFITWVPDPDIPPVIIGQWWCDQIAAKYPDLIHIEEPDMDEDDIF